jgi:transcriptional regulator with XRE-family HTH domain
MSEIYPVSDSDPASGWYSNEAATFGDRVAAGREAMGWTQVQLCRRLGIKLKTLQNWENDVSEPRANKLQMLAGVLNVSLMWLLNGEGEGLVAPGEEAEISHDLASVLAEVRLMRIEATRYAARLGQLEKRLRKALEA